MMTSSPAEPMREIVADRGDTAVEISYKALDPGAAVALGDDAPADVELRVITIIKPTRGPVIRCAAGRSIDFACTLRGFLTADAALHTISSELSNHSGTRAALQFAAAASHWLTDISSVACAAAQEALCNGAGFSLYAKVRIFCRPELHKIATAIGGYIVPSPRGETELAGGVGMQSVRFSGGGGGFREKACPICFEEFAEGAELMRMGCSHEFHGQCIYRWFERKLACPLCRRRLTDR